MFVSESGTFWHVTYSELSIISCFISLGGPVSGFFILILLWLTAALKMTLRPGGGKRGAAAPAEPVRSRFSPS